MNQKAFWPSVYKVNINKYPDVITHYGNANQVMRAEKRWIWDALHYGEDCAVLDATECRNSVENRHKLGGRQPYSKKPAFKKCRYKTNGTCTAAVVKYAKSLQFMRWLLNEVEPQAFREYVRQFPHQLTEADYGYNLEEERQYIPINVVEELQEEILPQSVVNVDNKAAQQIQYQIAPIIVTGRRAEMVSTNQRQKSSIDNIRIKECIRNNKALEAELQEREEDAERYAEQYQNEAEEHGILKSRFKELARDLSESKLTINELEANLDEARRYAVDCAQDRLALKSLRNEMKELSKAADVDLTDADVQRAFKIMQSTIGENVLQAMKSVNSDLVTDRAQEIRRRIVKLRTVIDSKIEPSKKAAALLKFYVKLFNTNGLVTDIVSGTKSKPILQRARTQI